MTQEEKAKRYDEVVKEIKGFFEGKQKMPNDVDKTLELLFPELKEDNDEKIMKAIVSGMTTLKELGKETFATININDCISWLEKQSEQKPQGKSTLEAINEEKVDNANKVEPKDYSSIDPHFFKPTDKTVEECNITGIGSKHAQGKLGEMIKNLKSVNETLEQKPAWSEEDESMLFNVINRIEQLDHYWNKPTDEKLIDWLKSIKERVQPQNKCKKSLTTADLENSLCDIQDGFSDTSYEYRILGEAIEFIRCTEQKPQWKPSDEQMEVLLSEVTAWSKGCTKQKVLESLYQDLKKL